MGKKHTKKSDSFAERLLQALRKGTGDELASEAETQGMSSEVYGSSFEQARGMLSHGPDPRILATLPDVFQVAFLAMAADDEDDELIHDLLGMTQSKGVKKEAKRVLHRLRSKGLDVAASEATGGSILDRRVAEDNPELPCYVTPVTGSGSRMIWLASYVRGGVGVYQVEINDEDGLLEFAGGVIGRSRYRSLTRDILQNEQASMLEISYAEARSRIARAVDRTREKSRALPEGYLEASSTLPDAREPAEIPDPREAFPDAARADSADLLREAADLHDRVEFSDWVPDEDVLKSFHAKLQEIESSQVTINKQQRVDQVNRAMDQAVLDLLADEERRSRYQERLLEMAVFLSRTGKETEAGHAAAAAWQLTREEFDPLQSPFFVRLVRKMFRTAEEIADQMKGSAATGSPDEPGGEKSTPDSGNLIVPP